MHLLLRPIPDMVMAMAIAIVTDISIAIIIIITTRSQFLLRDITTAIIIRRKVIATVTLMGRIIIKMIRTRMEFTLSLASNNNTV